MTGPRPIFAAIVAWSDDKYSYELSDDPAADPWLRSYVGDQYEALFDTVEQVEARLERFRADTAHARRCDPADVALLSVVVFRDAADREVEIAEHEARMVAIRNENPTRHYVTGSIRTPLPKKARGAA